MQITERFCRSINSWQSSIEFDMVKVQLSSLFAWIELSPSFGCSEFIFLYFSISIWLNLCEIHLRTDAFLLFIDRCGLAGYISLTKRDFDLDLQ